MPVSQTVAPPPAPSPILPAAVVATQHPAESAASPAATYAPIPPPSFAAAAVSKRDTRSLESRVGSQWFNRIGILAILIGMAWFLKFAIDNEWIGPLGRVVIGLISGVAIIVWSERFRAKNYIAFSYSLKAVGTGVLYLSLWAAFSLYHLVPAPVAFLGMIAVTAFNGYLAWAQDAELLALYAIVGALGTPLLVSTGENSEVTLFAYLLLLDVTVLLLVILRPWSRLLFGAFLGTVIYVSGWWIEFYSQSQAGRTGLFLILFFLIFAFAPRLVRTSVLGSGKQSGWDAFATIVLPVCNAALGFVGFYGLLEPKTESWTAPWLAVAFAAFYLLLLRLRAGGRLHESSTALSSLHLSTAVVFLTLAIPLKTQGRWLTVGWLVEGAALLWTARRMHSQLLRVLSLICLTLGLLVLIANDRSASLTPVINERFGTYCVAIAVFGFVAWLSYKHRAEDPNLVPGWTAVAGTAVLIVNALILLAVSLEIHAFWSGQWRDYTEYRSHTMAAQFTYSAFFMLFGAILLGIGFWRRTAFFRWQGLVLLAFAIGKVFIVDISELSQGFRILSFLGLGALLLAVSFVYQKDWLNLRSHGSDNS
ncbi:MAG: DUF2339 domain-containing protein [Acidobacteria bacterium]|nr:DUF2339 domain-containing protein [Acidobacteriota bacterium]